MDLPGAFFLPDGDRLVATEITRGPWSRELQHGGPPAALLARAIERRAAEADVPLQLARLTVEFWKPIPIAPLRVRAEVLRAGRKVQVHEALLEGEKGPLGRASATLVRRAETGAAAAEAAALRALDGPASGGALDLPGPDACEPFEFPFFENILGYHKGVETRRARGVFGRGALAVWFRMRVPLVQGEEPTPAQRVVLAADSGNGVSVALDPARWTFVPPDLTIALHRPLEGEWVCLDAATTPGATGAGLAEARLLDAHGPIGRSLQSLVIEAR